VCACVFVCACVCVRACTRACVRALSSVVESNSQPPGHQSAPCPGQLQKAASFIHM
jgi:hypothetical protein